jgi:sulfur carrier protein ThiS
VTPGMLAASGGEYRAVLLPNIERIESATLASLQQLATQGVPIYLAGTRPRQQPGFRDADIGDRAVQEGVAALLAKGARAVDLVEDDIAGTLAAVVNNSRRSAVKFTGDSAIRRYHRLLENDGSIQLFANQGPTPATVTLQVPPAQPLWWFDALEGVAWPVQGNAREITLSLRGFESRFLIAGVPLPERLSRQVAAGAALQKAGRRWPLQTWAFRAAEYSAQWDHLPDWRTLDALRYARSGHYQQAFTLDTMDTAARYLLDLGLVQGSAAVSVNGQAVGRASVPPFTIDITPALVSGENSIEIEVLAPLRNVFVGRAQAGDELYRHMAIYADSLVAAGLLGPVVLAEVREPEAESP